MPTHSIRKPFTAFFFALIAVVCLGTGCTPSGPKALLQGEQLIRKGKHAAAIAKLRIATELMRNEPRAWNYLGLAYHLYLLAHTVELQSAQRQPGICTPLLSSARSARTPSRLVRLGASCRPNMGWSSPRRYSSPTSCVSRRCLGRSG